MKDAPIIVTEIPRSGAALIARALRVCGAWCDVPVDGAVKLDDEGTNRRIREHLVRPLFKGMGANPLGFGVFPDIERCRALAPEIAPAWRRVVQTILSDQGFECGTWMYRGAEALLIWPIWAAAFPEARWVIARRDDNGIIKSCMKTGYMKGPQEPSYWRAWLTEYKLRLDGLTSSNCETIPISPGRVLAGKSDGLEALVRALSLSWDAARVEDALLPVIWSEGVYSFEEAA